MLQVSVFALLQAFLCDRAQPLNTKEIIEFSLSEEADKTDMLTNVIVNLILILVN